MDYNTPITVSIVEDDMHFLDRLKVAVETADGLVLGSVDTRVKDARKNLLKDRPDIILVDLSLPDGSGLEILNCIYEHKLDSKAMVISGFHDEKNVFAALEAGALGYIHKLEDTQAIIAGIEQMLDGDSPISPVIAKLMLKKFQRRAPAAIETGLPTVENLTDKQQSILLLISQGFTSQEIAEKQGISYHTVTTHIKNIYGKLQVNNRAEAVYRAREQGLIN